MGVPSKVRHVVEASRADHSDPEKSPPPRLRVIMPPEDVPEDSAGTALVLAAQDAPTRGEQPRADRELVSPAERPRLVPTEELLAELSDVSTRLETASPQDILRWSAQRFGDALTMATAFGPEGMVIIHMLSEIAPEMHIFNLDTGYQFRETLELRERVRERYGIEVVLERADTTVAEYEALHNGPLYKINPDQCCHDRKVVVLQRAIRGRHAWISAIRRDQSPDRAKAPIVGWDKKFQLVKVNPLANWSKSDVWRLITEYDIPYNPLHDQGYTSIGCWPCTRAVLFGEDERAGRWSGTQKTECGLHSLAASDSPPEEREV